MFKIYKLLSLVLFLTMFLPFTNVASASREPDREGINFNKKQCYSGIGMSNDWKSYPATEYYYFKTDFGKCSFSTTSSSALENSHLKCGDIDFQYFDYKNIPFFKEDIYKKNVSVLMDSKGNRKVYPSVGPLKCRSSKGYISEGILLNQEDKLFSEKLNFNLPPGKDDPIIFPEATDCYITDKKWAEFGPRIIDTKTITPIGEYKDLESFKQMCLNAGFTNLDTSPFDEHPVKKRLTFNGYLPVILIFALFPVLIAFIVSKVLFFIRKNKEKKTPRN